MIVLNLVSGATHVVLAGVVAFDGPIGAALALAAMGTIYTTIYEPAIIALTPQIVGERDLAAANSLNGMIDNGAVVVGPALGAVVLVWFSPEAALLVNAATFVYAAFATQRVRTRSTPTDVTEGGGKGPLAQMIVGFRALAESRTARVLVGFSVAASLDTTLPVADRVVALAQAAGVALTPAGATYPGGVDPHNSNIRLAPSRPPVAEVELAMAVVATCIKLASAEYKTGRAEIGD